MQQVCACSEFVADSLRRDASLLPDLLRADALTRRRGDGADPCWPDGLPLPADADEPACLAWLRRWRRRELVRIAWRDLAGWAPLQETLDDLSAFADQALSVAYQHAWRATSERFGTPRFADGCAMPMVVLGMGKLGGGELNFSSDIDLIFLFPEGGETDHSAPVSHDEFFLRLGQTLIRLLAAPTVDGFVFRVDMRLRPFGDSGALACSFAALEDYLTQHGRDWERYAYVKARALCAPQQYAELYPQVVRPFVYRRYLDFGVFESLREMKQLIEKQVARREMADHIKLGPGGIREIEFIVQAFQLIRGGQDQRLQTPSLRAVLPQLAGDKLLGRQGVEELGSAYTFLRTLENRIQMLHDAQTHELPRDELDRQRLVRAMHADSWPSLLQQLDAHRERVTRHFQALVFRPAANAGDEPQGAPAEPLRTSQLPLWDDSIGVAPLAQALRREGFAAPEEAARLLEDFRSGSLVRRLDTPSLRRLQILLPALIAEFTAADDHLVLLRRLLRVIEAIGARSAYFALLNENPAALRRFVDICRGGEFLTAQIAAHPLLLDELMDERVLAEPPLRSELARELVDRIARVTADDPERLVESLCQFKHAAVFRVAVGDLSGRIPIMRVSDYLTDIAELIVEQAMGQGWQQMTGQFGVPMCGAGAARRVVAVCAVGYGKLGGMELGYASDLDLVFLHDSLGERQETDHERPVDNQVFFIRLAQRIVHILTMHSAGGRLYEVDQRLRPSGKGGMLITQIDAFAEYQCREAWTWEHQALLHARSVAGAPALRAAFEAVRTDIVTHHVRRDKLRDDVREMRERMRRELSKSKAGEFDLKQDRGGMADIEFLAQYWALQWAHDYPPVAMFSDTIRQLESVASAALVPQATVDLLTGAYRDYRSRGHHRSLKDESAVVPASEFERQRREVASVWDSTFKGDV